MTDDTLRVDLSRYVLDDHEHASGCPAEPLRQEADVRRKPPARGLVQSGTTEAGEPVFTAGQQAGEKIVVARCCDCGAQRLFKLGERDG